MQRIAVTILLSSCAMFAQVATQTPTTSPQAPPPAPVVGVPRIGMSPQQPGTPAAPAVSPDTVVAMIDGKPWTAAQMDALLAELPVQTQTIVQKSPARFIQDFLNFILLEKKAEEDGLDKQSPYKQELFYQKLMLLANAEGEKGRNSIIIQRDQEEKYYEENKEAVYRVVNTKVIYIGYAAAAATKAGAKPAAAANPANGVTRTEAEAKAKIEGLRKQILAGADFGKLAKENSDDKTSAAKDGDYGSITRSSPYPAVIKDAIFKLKPGEVSEPIEQPSGIYLVKAVETSYQPFVEVEAQIRDLLTNQQFQHWQDDLRTHNKVTVEVPAYFSSRQPK